MTQSNTQDVILHLNEKWKGRKCPMCETGSWAVQKTIYELREYHGGSVVVGNGPLIPIIPVVCENCGNTIMVNAIIAGQVDRETK